MRIPNKSGTAAIDFTWADPNELVIQPESLTLMGFPKALERRLVKALTENESITISGGHTPKDLRPFWEGVRGVFEGFARNEPVCEMVWPDLQRAHPAEGTVYTEAQAWEDYAESTRKSEAKYIDFPGQRHVSCDCADCLPWTY